MIDGGNDESKLMGFTAKRVVVTGAAGFVGRNLVRWLHREEAVVRALDRATDEDGLIGTDFLDANAVRQQILDFKPELIFHLAAVGVSHTRSHDPTVIGENIAGLANLIDALSELETPTKPLLVLVGTMFEYGSAASPIAESAPCRPTTAYAISKHACTQLLKSYAASKGLRFVVGRLFMVFGPGEPQQRLIPTLVHRLSMGQDIPLSDGRQARDFIHVDDACYCLCRLATCSEAEGKIINVGTGRAVSIRLVAEKIAELLSADSALLKFGARARSPGDEDRLEADVTRLRHLLNWTPRQRFENAAAIEELFCAISPES